MKTPLFRKLSRPVALSVAGIGVATSLGCFLLPATSSPVEPGSPAPPALSPPVAPGVPTGGTNIIATDWRGDFLSRTKPLTEFGGLQPGADSLKLITTKQPEHIYSLEAGTLNRETIKKGDTLLVQFAARSLKTDKTSGVTRLKASFGLASPPWSASYQEEISLSSEWKRFDMPFRAKDDFAPGTARLNFSFGYPEQELEITDVRVLRYGAAVTPESLPKTKRYADALTPEALQKEVARIVALKQELTAVKNPSPANGRVLHVEIKGSAKGDGSVATPFATIPQALAVAKPSDTVLVGAGEWREPKGISVSKSGTPDAWIKIKAAPGARPKIITSNWSGIEMRGGIAYIEIEGLELEWKADPSIVGENGITVHGVGIAPMYASHHLRFLNNVIHGYGTGGICSLDCDYVYLEGNTIYDTAKTSPYGGSAISLCRAFNSDDKPGYHNVVRRNVCFDNELKVSVLETSGGNGKALTDGNGIIIDVFQRSRANPLKPHGEDRNGPLLPYRGRTLIENNLIYNNGGRGIHIFRSEKVDILNNTCYMNQKTPDISAGELTAIEAKQVVFLNNIAFARPEKRANTQDGSSGIVWSHNLIAGGKDILLHDGVMGQDPRFAAPSLTAKPDGFLLLPGSPAIGKAIAAVVPKDDLVGKTRPASDRADLGALPRQNQGGKGK